MKTRLPWLLWAICVVFTVITLSLLLINGDVRPEANFGSSAIDAAFAIAILMFPTVGATIAGRQPDNPIGWLFLVAGLGGTMSQSLLGYATYALLTNPGSMPGGALAGLIADAVWWTSIISSLALVLLLFPTGRLLSRRWRWLVGLIVAHLAIYVTAALINPGPLYFFPGVMNPLGLGAPNPVNQTIVDLGGLLHFPWIVFGVAGLAIRFRRSAHIERLQIRWLLYAAALETCVAPSMAILSEFDAGNTALVAVEVVLATLIGTIPLAVGIAILRYRLYDIDVVINRTLVYGGLTLTLGAAYLGTVLLLQLILSPVTAGSGLAVAASTLAVAALFRPARTRIQAVVDHRFYRRRYDAARTLEAFGTRLRNELDLEPMADDLRGVVRDTMQPAHVSLWLRGAD